jgi:hypothetical protein
MNRVAVGPKVGSRTWGLADIPPTFQFHHCVGPWVLRKDPSAPACETERSVVIYLALAKVGRETNHRSRKIDLRQDALGAMLLDEMG